MWFQCVCVKREIPAINIVRYGKTGKLFKTQGPRSNNQIAI